MLKIGDKIKIIDYDIFAIDEEVRKEHYEISDAADISYFFEVEGSSGGTYRQSFGEEDIGVFVEKIEE